MASAGIIDVHHHVTPPKRLADMQARRQGEAPTLGWTLDKTLAMMAAGNVATAMLSVPNVYLGDRSVVRDLARHCNEYTAQIVANHPRGKFGLFACLPLPDVDAALAEIDFAFGALQADGVVLMTSCDNKWLGDPAWAPVLDELNRRKAVVFVHPRAAECCRGLLPMLSDAIVEFETDTVRAIASLLFTGTQQRCPDIRFIFSHGGGALPSMIERFVQAPLGRPALAALVPDGAEAAVRRFYYDIAQSSHRIPLSALVQLVSARQIVFGTDFPYRTALEHSAGLRAIGLSEGEIAAIERGNALSLLPRLGG